jgi:hypothetical protein
VPTPANTSTPWPHPQPWGGEHQGGSRAGGNWPGGLPVTGADLATLAATGLALIAAGLILRRTSGPI